MPAHTHTADETFTPYYELLPRYWFQCSIPQFLPAFTPTRLYVMCLKKNRQFSSRAEKSPVLDLAYQLDSHPLSLSSPSSLFASCHAQTVFQSFWIPSFCISTHTLLSHPPSQLPFLPAKQLMSLPVWETYGKRLVTAWRMWRRVKEDGVLTPMCETQSITDFFLTLSGVKQVLSKQFTRPHRHLWGVIITQCCSCLITLRGFCNADEGLFYFLHYSHISILQKLNKTASAELRWHRIDL